MVSEEETVTTKSRFYRDLLSFSLLRPHLFVTGCNFRKRISAWRQYRYSGDRVNGCLTNTGKMAIKKGPRPPSLLFRLGEASSVRYRCTSICGNGMPILLASSARLKFSIRSKYTFQYSALVVQERVTKFRKTAPSRSDARSRLWRA